MPLTLAISASRAGAHPPPSRAALAGSLATWRHPRDRRSRDPLFHRRCGAGSAAVLADTSAAGQTRHVRAADQAIETGVDRAAGAGETEIRWLLAGAARSAVAGAAARTAITPVAVSGACGASVGAASAALPARSTDAPAARRAGTARTADQPTAAGMLG